MRLALLAAQPLMASASCPHRLRVEAVMAQKPLTKKQKRHRRHQKRKKRKLKHR
jgi:hypothetical protein